MKIDQISSPKPTHQRIEIIDRGYFPNGACFAVHQCSPKIVLIDDSGEVIDEDFAAEQVAKYIAARTSDMAASAERVAAQRAEWAEKEYRTTQKYAEYISIIGDDSEYCVRDTGSDSASEITIESTTGNVLLRISNVCAQFGATGIKSSVDVCALLHLCARGVI